MGPILLVGCHHGEILLRSTEAGGPRQRVDAVRDQRPDRDRPGDVVPVRPGRAGDEPRLRGQADGVPRAGDQTEAPQAEGRLTMAEKLIKRGNKWYYRFTDADGRRVMRKGCSDRRETERMAAAAEIEAAQIRSGLVDPKDLGYRDHEARPLSDHFTAYAAYLQ